MYGQVQPSVAEEQIFWGTDPLGAPALYLFRSGKGHRPWKLTLFQYLSYAIVIITEPNREKEREITWHFVICIGEALNSLIYFKPIC